MRSKEELELYPMKEACSASWEEIINKRQAGKSEHDLIDVQFYRCKKWGIMLPRGKLREF
uniref:Uncharacterized protein n=1 Tax=Megaselia scalaris TaxID=36166 RepID=T1GZU6_MEGSC